MSKLIIMRGLPASGKSTKAKEIVEQGGNYVRLNRDLLRTMLHFNKWSGNNEAQTIVAMKSLARTYLTGGVSVVVDDTNLGDKHRQSWSSIAQECDAKFEVVDMETSLSECLIRDLNRDQRVGNAVILCMALQYGIYPKPAKPFVICDIDGTVADCEHRKHHLSGEKKDWKSFFSDMKSDTPRTEVIEQLREYHDNGHEVVFVSARPEDYRNVTESWLNEHVHINYVNLIMRRSGDKRLDTEVKEQIFKTYFDGKYPIEVVFDDRPSIVRMWRSHGLNVIDVGDGVEF